MFTLTGTDWVQQEKLLPVTELLMIGLDGMSLWMETRLSLALCLMAISVLIVAALMFLVFDLNELS